MISATECLVYKQGGMITVDMHMILSGDVVV